MSKTTSEFFHKILFLKVNLNLCQSTAKAIVEKPCVQVKQFEIAMEQSYYKWNLGQWDLKLSDNPSVQVRTPKGIHTFVANVLEMHSKEEKLFYAQQKIRFEDRIFSVLDTDQ